MAPWGSQAHWPFVCAFLCFAESLSGEEQCTLSAPGAPKARPAAPSLGSRIRAIQESVGKVGAWGGAWGWCPLGPGAEGDPGQAPSFHGCLCTCEMGGLGHSASSGSPCRIWLIHLICSSLSQTCRSPGSHLGLPRVGSAPSADRGLGKVTYFPGSWAFPSSSFLIATVDGEAGPCRGLF